MDKFSAQFEEIMVESKEPTMEPPTPQNGEFTTNIPIRKTLLTAVVAGTGAFITMSLLSVFLSDMISPILSKSYAGMVSELGTNLDKELESVLLGFDWKHILLGIHQQFGTILIAHDLEQKVSLLEMNSLLIHIQLGFGIFLVIPFAVLVATYQLCKRRLSEDKRLNRLFLFVTSAIYSIFMGCVAMLSNETVVSQEKGIAYDFTFSAISIATFSMVMCALFLYIPVQIHERKWQNNIKREKNPLYEALLLTLQFLVLSYLIVVITILFDANMEGLGEMGTLFALMLAPLFMGVLLFSKLSIVDMDKGDHAYSSYSISEGLYSGGSSNMEELHEVVQYLASNQVLKVTSILLIMYLLNSFIRKGYILAKYSSGKLMWGALHFSAGFAGCIILVVYLSTYHILFASGEREREVPYRIIELFISVDIIPLLMNAFFISLCFTLIGAVLHQLKIRRNVK